MTPQNFDRTDDEALSAAARSLHEEWETPALWPAIATRLRQEDLASSRRWGMPASMTWRLAAAAVLLLAVSSTTWVLLRSGAPTRSTREVQASDERLLTDEAVAAIDRSEEQYVKAIDELTRLTKPKLDMPDSPLIVSLRDRLTAIDAAIAECRKEIDRNRFNALLRQQLLWIYQEKRRTLQQVQESDGHAL
ncbi:MAG TPA: hypothetical protein VKB50_16175 [Vicinamibacterales bacterium]|nr:hypothetical protein [Vicinamibacterales bacterium]